MSHNGFIVLCVVGFPIFLLGGVATFCCLIDEKWKVPEAVIMSVFWLPSGLIVGSYQLACRVKAAWPSKPSVVKARARYADE